MDLSLPAFTHVNLHGGHSSPHGSRYRKALLGQFQEPIRGGHTILGLQMGVPSNLGQDPHHLPFAPVAVSERRGDVAGHEEGRQIGLPPRHQLTVRLPLGDVGTLDEAL